MSSSGLHPELGKQGRQTRKRGMKLCILVSDTNSCKSAYKFLKGFFTPCVDEVHCVTAITSEAARAAALARQQEVLEPELQEGAHYHVVLKEEEYSLQESLGRYLGAVVRPHLVFMASTNLCTAPQPASSAPFRPNQPSPGAFTTPRPFSASGRPTSLAYGAPSTTSGPNSFFTRPVAQRPQVPTGPGAAGGALLGNSSLALRILPEIRCAPVLLVKYNSRGAWLTVSAMSASSSASSLAALSPLSSSSSTAAFGGLSSSGTMSRMSSTGGLSSPRAAPQRPASALPRMGSAARSAATAAAAAAAAGGPGAGGWVAPMRVMVDLQANSRHVLEWLFAHLTAGRDHLLLSVSHAFDDQHRVKPAAQRLLTAFGVQASVNSFHADTAVYPGPAHKCLPQAVVDAEPDLLVLQTPRCKGLPSALVELLYTAKTSFLIWPPDYAAS